MKPEYREHEKNSGLMETLIGENFLSLELLAIVHNIFIVLL